MVGKSIAAMLLACAVPYGSGAAFAESVAEFYTGKRITIVIGGGPGSGNEVYARLLSEFMTKWIPGNPILILQFMPGSGGVKAANYVYNVAAGDGSVMGMPLSPQPTTQAMGHSGVRYDATEFRWIGRMVDVVQLATVRRDAGVASLDDIRRKEVVAGTTRPGAANHFMFALMNAYLSTQFKIVTGYEGTGGVALAYERGEVHAQAAPYSSIVTSKPAFLNDIKLVQIGLEKEPREPDVPLLLDLVKDPKAKAVVEFMSVQAAIGRSFYLPPKVPADRVKALRQAFDQTMADPALRAKAAQRKMDLSPLDGRSVQRIVERHMATPAKIVDEAKKAAQIK